jgi:hypothetical protein
VSDVERVCVSVGFAAGAGALGLKHAVCDGTTAVWALCHGQICSQMLRQRIDEDGSVLETARWRRLSGCSFDMV